MAKVTKYLNPTTIAGGAKGIVKEISVGAAMAIVEAGTEAADKIHEMKIKRRDDAIKYLEELEILKQKGTITQEEFEEKRKKALKKIKV